LAEPRPWELPLTFAGRESSWYAMPFRPQALGSSLLAGSANVHISDSRTALDQVGPIWTLRPVTCDGQEARMRAMRRCSTAAAVLLRATLQTCWFEALRTSQIPIQGA